MKSMLEPDDVSEHFLPLVLFLLADSKNCLKNILGANDSNAVPRKSSANRSWEERVENFTWGNLFESGA